VLNCVNSSHLLITIFFVKAIYFNFTIHFSSLDWCRRAPCFAVAKQKAFTVKYGTCEFA